MLENKKVPCDDVIDINELAKITGPLKAEDLGKVKELIELQKIMSDGLINRFLDNIEAFKKYLPDIAKQFEHYRPQRTMDFFCTSNGIPNLMFVDNNDILYKTSDPFELCKLQVENCLKTVKIKQVHYPHEYDWCGQIHHRYLNEFVSIDEKAKRENLTPLDIGSVPCCVLLGLGLGYELAYLYERIEIANLIIIEPDSDVFFASLHAFDWANLLEFIFTNNYGINIMVGQTPDELFEDMSTFFHHHGRFLSSFWWNYVHYSNEKIKALSEILIKDYYRVHAAMGFFDDHLFGTSHACSHLEKGKNFVIEHTLPEQMANTPVFVIGSGPSLDNDIPFLRKNQDKAIIIACGTAIDTLYHAGIKPDFYACTERTPQISETLEAIPDKKFLEDIILLAGDVVHPFTVKYFKHTAIFAKGDEPFYWLLISRLVGANKLLPVHLMNPFVGNMGVSGALTLGFKKLYLFGIDNGKKLNTSSMHSKYTKLYNADGVDDTKGNYILSNIKEGNFGGEIESSMLFTLSGQNISSIVKSYKDKDVLVYNCSDGMKLEYIPPLHSYDLDLSDYPNVDKKTLLKFMDEEATARLQLSRDEIIKLISYDTYDAVIDKLIKLFSRPITSRVQLVQLMETCSEINTTLNMSLEQRYLGFMLEGSLQSMFIMMSHVLYHTKDEKTCLKVVSKMVKLLIYFLLDSKALYRHLPDYELGPHQEYLDGKVGFDHEESKAPDMPLIPKLIEKKAPDEITKFVKCY